MDEGDFHDIAGRVAREKESSDIDDVLTQSFVLKGLFSHTLTCPSTMAFALDMDEEIIKSKGMHILDFGCGKGDSAFKFLQAGASVIGIDISQNYIEEANRHAKELGFDPDSYEFRVMDAHNLEFESDHFDVVYGKGILHHLDLPVSLSEINRVLKVGGRAIFLEPLAGNPLLKLLRWLTPSARTEDERPLSGKDLRAIEKSWRNDSNYYGLLCAPVAAATSIVLRPFPNNILIRGAFLLESLLVRRQVLNSWHQYVLLRLIKKEAPNKAHPPSNREEVA